MEAIYSSKLFKASNRQDKIRAALANPLNVELVQQLRSYLDDDEVSKITDEPDSSVEDTQVPGEVYEEDKSSGGASMKPSGHSGGGGYHSSLGDEKPSDDKESLSDIVREDELGTMPSDDVVDVPEVDDEVSESQDISGVESTEVPVEEFTVSDIQKELNSNYTTEGVRRVTNKNSEIWIYYNDDVNLNTVMENVISKLEKLDDKRVEFNRLARTENAIVFEECMD